MDLVSTEIVKEGITKPGVDILLSVYAQRMHVVLGQGCCSR